MNRFVIPATAAAALVAVAVASGAGRAAPVNQSPPTITGSALVGKTLTADHGKWSGSGNTYRYSWQRCDSAGASCTSISGATGTKYTVVSADLGKTLRVAVTASNKAGESATATSDATQVVATTGGKPANTKPPTITGTATVGTTLTAEHGTWVGDEPITYSYAWQKCDSAGNACSAISGATRSTYTVQKSQVGKTLRVKVTATNSRGKGEAISPATPQVQDAAAPGGIVTLPNGGKSVDAADVPKGERLIVDKVVFNPNPVSKRTTPITVTITVKDTRGYYVRNALVFFRSTPILTETPQDAKTATDGRIVYSVLPRSDFPLKSGYNVQFYVKAYRHGDPTLAGISGTRLVQVATSG